jgi:GrpB-like predicted nucleotidyltransferase (UPF0157 family)
VEEIQEMTDTNSNPPKVEHEAPFEAWRQLRDREGSRVSVITLYRMVAETRGLEAQQLPIAERLILAKRAMPIVWPGFETVPGSDDRYESIEVVPYRPEWLSILRTWRARLNDTLGDKGVRIEHIGSTSVPGLAAKPIVDIQLSVDHLDEEDHYMPGCEAAGLQLRSRDDFHRYFRPPREQARDVHLHVCEAGGRWERDHLIFRDFLRTHSEARIEYSEAKFQAASMWADDRIGYTEAKNDVILGLLEQAESWAEKVGWSV